MSNDLQSRWVAEEVRQYHVCVLGNVRSSVYGQESCVEKLTGWIINKSEAACPVRIDCSGLQSQTAENLLLKVSSLSDASFDQLLGFCVVKPPPEPDRTQWAGGFRGSQITLVDLWNAQKTS